MRKAPISCNSIASHETPPVKLDILRHSYRLLTLYTQTESLDFFCAKCGPAGQFLAIRSLNWFGETETEPDPIYLNRWTWPLVCRRMATLARALIQ